MTKLKPPSKPPTKQPAKSRQPTPTALMPTQPALRWQRTQRYVWDQGGKKSGNGSGRR